MKQTQINQLRLIKQSLDRVVTQHVRRAKAEALHNYATVAEEQAIADIFPTLAGMTKPPRTPEEYRGIYTTLVAILRVMYTSDRRQDAMMRDFVRDLWKHAAEYDLLAQMPPPRRQYTKRAPRTLVERRADGVDEKVREWERKLKLAKTKLATYRKKQKYYTKKGAVK